MNEQRMVPDVSEPEGEQIQLSPTQQRRIFKHSLRAPGISLLLFAVMQIIVPVIFALVVSGGEEPEALGTALSNGYLFSMACLFNFMVGVLPFWGVRKLWQEATHVEKRMTRAQFLPLMCIAFSMQLLFILFRLVMLLVSPSVSRQLDALTEATSSESLVMYAWLVGPIIEELVFRGFLMNVFKPRGKVFAIVASSILFGLYHANLVQGIFAFAIGAVLGYVALTYSLEWSIVLHILNNFAFTALSELLRPILGEAGVGLLNIMLMTAFFVLGSSFLMYHKKDIRTYLRKNSTQGRFYRWTFTEIFFLLFALANLALMVYPFFA